MRATCGRVSPRLVFDAIDASGAFAEEMVFTRTGAVIRTLWPRGLVASLEDMLESKLSVLVMPILEDTGEAGFRLTA